MKPAAQPLTRSQDHRLTLPAPGASGDAGTPGQGQKPLSESWFCCRHTVHSVTRSKLPSLSGPQFPHP